MRRTVALSARCWTHRQRGLEQEGPRSGAHVGGRKPGHGPWWELLLIVGEAGRKSLERLSGPGDNHPGSEPRIIARQVDYTASRSLVSQETRHVSNACPHCQSSTKKFGRTSDGRQRYRCLTCRKVTVEAKVRLLPGTRVPDDRTLSMVLQLLCEGASVRAVERLTGTEKRTVLRLLKQAGEGCERMMASVVKDVKVQDVECDEIWSFVRCKEATKKRKKIDDLEAGDCYCFTALERHSKLLLAFQVGRRNTYEAHDFMAKVSSATAGEFQISTDAWSGYRNHRVQPGRAGRLRHGGQGVRPGSRRRGPPVCPAPFA